MDKKEICIMAFNVNNNKFHQNVRSGEYRECIIKTDQLQLEIEGITTEMWIIYIYSR
jgi:hypothetical protein